MSGEKRSRKVEKEVEEKRNKERKMKVEKDNSQRKSEIGRKKDQPEIRPFEAPSVLIGRKAN